MANRIKQIVNEVVDNFLNDYRGSTNNHAKLVSINENNVKRMISTHSKSGYIVISPCRSGADFGIDPEVGKAEADKLAHINKVRVKGMIDDIKKSGFSYTPTYGGFIENKGEENETEVYERSFIIYNHYKDGNEGDFNDLYEFGLMLCKKYNQDSFLVQAPNETPKYITKNGDVDFEFNGNMSFNDLSQEYFTDLHKNTNKGDISNRKPTRFSFTEAYINPKPQCYSERHVRHLNGEVFLT